jgi:uncharacterized cupredoxin-like copper-binding protein
MPTHLSLRRTSLAGLSCLAAAAALGACGSSNDNTTTSTASSSSSSGTAASRSAAGTGYYGSSGGAAGTSKPATSTTAPGTVTLEADASGALAFDQTTLTAKAGKVTVDMRNPATSGVPHGIAVEGGGVDQDGKTVAPGGTSTVTVTLKPGTYTFYCPVPGHKQAGMKGTLTVR